MSIQPIDSFVDADGQAWLRLSNGHKVALTGGGTGGGGGSTEGPQGPPGPSVVSLQPYNESVLSSLDGYIWTSPEVWAAPTPPPADWPGDIWIDTGDPGTPWAGAVTAGNGLTGGGSTSPSATLHVGAGSGVSVAADSVAINRAVTDVWYAARSHTHTAEQVGFQKGRYAAGTLVAGATKTLSIPHGLGKTPEIALVTCYNDGGTALSGVASVNTMSSTNIGVKVRNINTSESEALDVSWLVA